MWEVTSKVTSRHSRDLSHAPFREIFVSSYIEQRAIYKVLKKIPKNDKFNSEKIGFYAFWQPYWIMAAIGFEAKFKVAQKHFSNSTV